MLQKSELVDKLELVAPALSKQDYIPVFTKFVFDGETVSAYNDRLGISVDCDTGLEACVSGMLLLSLLKSSNNDTVSFKTEGGSVLFNCGSKFELPMMPVSERLYSHPKIRKNDKTVLLTNTWLQGIKMVLVSVQESSTRPELTCVNWDLPDGMLYATDGVTISSFDLGAGSAHSRREYLPAEFCRAVIAMSEFFEQKEFELLFTGDGILASFDGGHVFTKYISVAHSNDSDRGLDFKGQIERVMQKDALCYINIPPDLPGAIARAQLVMGREDFFVGGTTVAINKGEMRLITSTSSGAVEDQLSIDKKHPNVSVSVNPKLVDRALNLCTSFCVLPSCITMTDEGAFNYVVAIFA